MDGRILPSGESRVELQSAKLTARIDAPDPQALFLTALAPSGPQRALLYTPYVRDTQCFANERATEGGDVPFFFLFLFFLGQKSWETDGFVGLAS